VHDLHRLAKSIRRRMVVIVECGRENGCRTETGAVRFHTRPGYARRPSYCHGKCAGCALTGLFLQYVLPGFHDVTLMALS